MANVSGKVLYDASRTATGGVGIPNVPVVLIHPVLGTGAVCLTDATGNYQFNNVPAGVCNVTKAWGSVGGLASPVNFATAASAKQGVPPAQPPVSALVGVVLPPLISYLDALTPTLVDVTVAGSDITGKDFYDGPVGNKTMTLKGVTTSGVNLLTAADGGTWGTRGVGSSPNTIPATEPYPGIAPGFTYSNGASPSAGGYTVSNTTSGAQSGAWWTLSDHSKHMETGRLALFNAAAANAVCFSQYVDVTPKSDYLASAWIANLRATGGQAAPVVNFKVSALDGTVLFTKVYNTIPETAIPVWYQSGCIFNSGTYSMVKIELLTGPVTTDGNDFALDDIAVQKVSVSGQLDITKQATPSMVAKGGTLTFAVALRNGLDVAATNVTFQDTLDPLFTLTAGSVKVNGSATGFESANPVTGFALPNIAPGATTTVTFAVTVPSLVDTAQNVAKVTYDVLATDRNDLITHTFSSSAVTVRLNTFDYKQVLVDLAEAIATEKRALAGLLNNVGTAKSVVATTSGITVKQLLAMDVSAGAMVQSVQDLESVLAQRLEMLETQTGGSL